MRTTAINTLDPLVRELAMKLTERLVNEMEPGPACATLVVALEILLCSILHMSSPIPEMNITATRQILADLTENVRWHETCAKAASPEECARKPVIH